jgi:hypothetical protein
MREKITRKNMIVINYFTPTNAPNQVLSLIYLLKDYPIHMTALPWCEVINCIKMHGEYNVNFNDSHVFMYKCYHTKTRFKLKM